MNTLSLMVRKINVIEMNRLNTYSKFSVSIQSYGQTISFSLHIHIVQKTRLIST